MFVSVFKFSLFFTHADSRFIHTDQSRNTKDAALPQYVFSVTDMVTKEDGTTFTVPEGRYRVLLRAQRTYTDAKLAASYDSWLSEPFTYAK